MTTPLRLSFLLLLALVLTTLSGCQKPKPAEPAAGPKVYTVKGEVMALDPEHHTATLKHEKIEGWMEAMTMEFPVKDPNEYAKLAVGDHLEANLYVSDLEYYLAKIQVTAKSAAH